ncbi:LysM peptidoglycan-binding domain-containing protein [Paenibacillus xylaniclasticus]|uniref:LysM peptidoglycan-binding domain-containing protein n=1 Tax=Paenibacillus xylaniclasticus TaxID=588083 RepID=UPI0013DFF532|nr:MULTISPECIES: LysM peptidoglycan-binding domain-containing protein [Paenibacillus]GFN33610.1 hypothetical protein PCURB6_38700 [Paenibacillus curdlanolyticus]
MKIHIVKRGDTLYAIAQKYGVTLEEILKLNPSITNPDVIDVGMKVKVPSSKHGSGGSKHSGGGAIMHQHVVKQGDTLWKLSKAWGVPLNDLIKANPQLKNPNVLLTGDIVNIPKVNQHHVHAQLNPVSSGGHNPFKPSSILNTVQDLAGKIPTGILPGKKPTGKTPTAPIEKTPTAPIGKTPTAPKAESAEQPPITLPAPTPAPIPAPIPAPMPAPEKLVVEKPQPYPVHVEYHQQNVHLFQQCGIPAVEAGAIYGVPHMPEHISPASTGYGYGEYGYGYGDQPAVSPIADTGYHTSYGAPDVSLANVGSEHYGYGAPSFVSPVNAGPEHYGYGVPTQVLPANVGPEHYGYGAPSQVSPVNVGPEHYGYGAPSQVSPASVGPEHYGYGAPSQVSPVNVGPEQYGYGTPSVVSPASVGLEHYGYGAPTVLPASIGHEQHGYGSPSLVSPANVGSDSYGYGNPALSPAGIEPFGYGIPSVSPAGISPEQYGYGSPTAVDPWSTGQSTWPYGAYPTWPVQQAVSDQSCGCGSRDEEDAQLSQSDAGVDTGPTVNTANTTNTTNPVRRNPPRKPVKKVSVRSVVPRPQVRRRSKPWINDR